MPAVALSTDQQRAALAFAGALLPHNTVIPGGDDRSVAAALRFAADIGPAFAERLGLVFQALDRAAIAFTGRRFSRLDADRREALLSRWQLHPVMATPLYLLSFIFKASHFDDEAVYASLGSEYEKGGPPEPARWLAQVMDGSEIDEPLECDVVVVGTGAGGAVVGKELAERGFAVLFVEEGELHRRDAFVGSSLGAKRRFYRGKATISALGNAVIPTFMGRLVGGSTAINTGTCYRTPRRILERWCEQLGTEAFAPDEFARYFERVEQILQVEEVKPELRGGLARVVARGCDALSWHHAPMRRNAPDCDAQGVCDFGCPSAARRSTDISYLPSALARSALLLTSTRAERVLIERGRAVGIEARALHGGGTVRVRARAVVLACGAVPTPLLLLEQGIANRSGWVGRNLSLHPACAAAARFDEQLDGHEAIPQTCYSSEWLDQGILINGASAPISVVPLMLPWVGRRLMSAMAEVRHMASLGVMVEDVARGRVLRAPGGGPRLRYRLGQSEVERLQHGLACAAEIFFAAGAREVYPMVSGAVVLEPDGGVARLRRMRLRPRDFVLTSFHPLGTCRMGRDPATSVIGVDHQCHDVAGLFIADGSSVPGPTAVNPQITIMAIATRAAEQIAESL